MTAEKVVGDLAGEGLVNVFRGSGKVWLAPVLQTGGSAGESSIVNSDQTASSGQTGTAAGKNDIVGKLEKVGKVMDFFS